MAHAVTSARYQDECRASYFFPIALGNFVTGSDDNAESSARALFRAQGRISDSDFGAAALVLRWVERFDLPRGFSVVVLMTFRVVERAPGSKLSVTDDKSLPLTSLKPVL
jgi:hypothetical protein